MSERRVPYLNDVPTEKEMKDAGIALGLFALAGITPGHLIFLARKCARRGVVGCGRVTLVWEDDNHPPVIEEIPEP